MQEIFKVFLDQGSLIATARELSRRGWTPKGCVGKIHGRYGDGSFDRCCLRRLLTTHAYVGEFAFDGHLFPAEHDAIVDRESWERAQTILEEAEIPAYRRPYLLAGILRCAPCDAVMNPSRVEGDRCYLCVRFRGRVMCASCLPAAEVERLVVEHLCAIGRDPKLLEATVDEAFYSLATRQLDLRDKIRLAQDDLDRAHGELRGLIEEVGTGPPRRNPRTAALKEQILDLQARVAKMRREVSLLRTLRIRPEEFRAALVAFDLRWEHSARPQRARLLRRLIERIKHEPDSHQNLTITFSPAGVHSLAAQPVPAAGVNS